MEHALIRCDRDQKLAYLVSVAKLATDCEIEVFHFLVDMHVCYMAHMHHATWN